MVTKPMKTMTLVRSNDPYNYPLHRLGCRREYNLNVIPPVGALSVDIGRAWGISKRAAERVLLDLHTAGRVTRERDGNNRVVWKNKTNGVTAMKPAPLRPGDLPPEFTRTTIAYEIQRKCAGCKKQLHIGDKVVQHGAAGQRINRWHEACADKSIIIRRAINEAMEVSRAVSSRRAD